MMKCCTECFRAQYVREYIARNGEMGDCEFCRATGEMCIETSELSHLFEPLLTLYVEASPETVWVGDPAEEGEFLADIIDYQWYVFSDGACDCRHDLISDMFPDDPREGEWGPGDTLYVDDPFPDWQTLPSEHWDRFVRHITEERRFILSQAHQHPGGPPDVHDPRDWLPEHLGLVGTQMGAGTSVWRARAWDDPLSEPDPDRPPQPDWLGAPCPERAAAGRANSFGIPVFYGALAAGTAAREVRPSVGGGLWMAEWRLTRAVRIADLAHVPYLETPFGVGDLRGELERRSFLRTVSDALSLPVSPHEEQFRYVPTQYVVEVIKDAGYDGVAYGSSQDPGGKNVALFDPSVLECTDNRQLIHTTGVSVQFDPALPSVAEAETAGRPKAR